MGIGYGPVTPASSHCAGQDHAVFDDVHRLFDQADRGSARRGHGRRDGSSSGCFLRAGKCRHCGWRPAGLILSFCLHPYRKRFDTERSNRSRLSWNTVIAPVKMTMLHPDLRRLAIASFFFSTMQLCLISFLVTYLIENIEMTLIQAGVLLSAAQASGIIGRIVWGAFADRYVKPAPHAGCLRHGHDRRCDRSGTLLASMALSGHPDRLRAFRRRGHWLERGLSRRGGARGKTRTNGDGDRRNAVFHLPGHLARAACFFLMVETTGSYPFGIRYRCNDNDNLRGRLVVFPIL